MPSEYDRRRWPTVYAIRHNPTGKIYVGSTGWLEMRLRQHINQLREGLHPNQTMQRDCDEYGDDYSFCILYECLPNSGLVVTKIEHLYMEVLGTTDPRIGYNVNEGKTKTNLDRVKFFDIPSCRLPEVCLDPRHPKEERHRRSKPTTQFYALRRAARIKGADLARELGVTRQAVEHWDRGASKPKPEYAVKIADIFGVTVDDLLKEDE